MKTAKAVPANYLCRIFSGDKGNHPVTVVPGTKSPKMVGESFGWEKVSGPNAGERVNKAYAMKYWRNVQYVHSSIETEVGAEWLNEPKNQAIYHDADGVRSVVLDKRAVRVGNIRVVPGWTTPGREKILLVTRGKRSYHASRGQLKDLTRETMEEAAAEAKAAWQAADDAQRQEKARAQERKVFLRELHNVRVTLEDSRRAGNCIEGSLTFAERKLGIPRAEILGASYLFSVPAKRLLAVANGDRKRVEAAIQIAWQRETMVSI